MFKYLKNIINSRYNIYLKKKYINKNIINKIKNYIKEIDDKGIYDYKTFTEDIEKYFKYFHEDVNMNYFFLKEVYDDLMMHEKCIKIEFKNSISLNNFQNFMNNTSINGLFGYYFNDSKVYIIYASDKNIISLVKLYF